MVTFHGIFHGIYWDIPSGYVKIAMENGWFIVDLPIDNGDFPVRYVSLPEANQPKWKLNKKNTDVMRFH